MRVTFLGLLAVAMALPIAAVDGRDNETSSGTQGRGVSVQGDPVAGKTVFHACRACHSLEDGVHADGPSLHGLFGRRAGALESYDRYSNALRRADFIWTEQKLATWLENPNSFLPGNRMNFAGLRREEDRADLIAYLRRETQ